MAGWTTFFLGPDTPVAEIADAARRLGVDAVVMSSSTHFHRVAVRHAVDALKKELPGTDIWVGGPAFVGAATGWLPQEVVDLDALLGDPAAGGCRRGRGRRHDAADDGADVAPTPAPRAGKRADVLSLRIATRFLRKSPVQSILIAAGIAVGIGVQVFLGSLITSLQASLVDQTIGNSPQVVVTAGQDGAAVAYTPQLQQAMEAQSEITTVVPTRAYSAIFRKGSESAPLQFTGGALDQLDTIYDISGRLVAGEASLDAGRGDRRQGLRRHLRHQAR